MSWGPGLTDLGVRPLRPTPPGCPPRGPRRCPPPRRRRPGASGRSSGSRTAGGERLVPGEVPACHERVPSGDASVNASGLVDERLSPAMVSLPSRRCSRRASMLLMPKRSWTSSPKGCHRGSRATSPVVKMPSSRTASTHGPLPCSYCSRSTSTTVGEVLATVWNVPQLSVVTLAPSALGTRRTACLTRRSRLTPESLSWVSRLIWPRISAVLRRSSGSSGQASIPRPLGVCTSPPSSLHGDESTIGHGSAGGSTRDIARWWGVLRAAPQIRSGAADPSRRTSAKCGKLERNVCTPRSFSAGSGPGPRRMDCSGRWPRSGSTGQGSSSST